METINQLPASLDENSGMVVESPNRIWYHMDHGDTSRIFQVDTFGNILRLVYFNGVENTDWEDMTVDDDGNFYLGDFGNNLNNRTDLEIYKIPNPSTFTGNQVTPQIISFSYEDQTEFPPAPNERNFDVEAMIWFQGSLYLFTKDRTIPYQSIVKMYKVPDSPGSYSATLEDTYYTQQAGEDTSIAGAAISPNGNALILINSLRAFVFYNFDGDNFFQGQMENIWLGNPTGKEAVAFVDDREVYISDETTNQGFATLYRLNLPDFVTSIQNPETVQGINVFPNPSRENINIRSEETAISSYELYHISGTLLETRHWDNPQLYFRIKMNKTGNYILKLKTKEGNHVQLLQIIE